MSPQSGREISALVYNFTSENIELPWKRRRGVEETSQTLKTVTVIFHPLYSKVI